MVPEGHKITSYGVVVCHAVSLQRLPGGVA
jgi:hypothetical protein